MFSYTFILAAALALRLAAAATPACLLAAVNTQPNVSDLEAICGSGAEEVQAAILSGCGAQAGVAADAFAAVCKTVDVTIDTGFTSSSASASATSTNSSNNATSTMMMTATYSDTSCDCIKTTSFMTTSTGFATATDSASTGADTSVPASGSSTGSVGTGSAGTRSAGTGSATSSGPIAVSTSGAMQSTVQFAATFIIVSAACLLAL